VTGGDGGRNDDEDWPEETATTKAGTTATTPEGLVPTTTTERQTMRTEGRAPTTTKVPNIGCPKVT
jgi:hypothetical protein